MDFKRTIAGFFLLHALSGVLLQATAQKTVVEGRVTDALTLEPVAFANVYFKSTQIGTITDFDGYFVLETDSPTDSLAVSCVGYAVEVKPIAKGERQKLTFSLMPASVDLSEVIIRPGENPAVTILRKVWENIPRNNIDRLEQYAVGTYTKTQVYLRPIFKTDTRRDPNRVFREHAIAAGENASSVLPVYMSEAISTNYYLRSPKREKVVVESSQTNSLVNVDAEIVTQLVQKSNRLNFNNNHVRFLDRNFVSPVSTSGLFYYKYYLEDSLYLDGHYCYAIRVVPRRAEDLAFNGTIWVNDSTYALKRLSLEVGANANFNFVDRLKIQQDLEPTEAQCWMPVKTRISADAVNIFVNVYVGNGKFSNTDYPLSFYDTELLAKGTGPHNMDDEKWRELRPAKPDSLDVKTLDGIANLGKVPYVRLLAGLVNMSVKGYYNLGRVELGPYLMFYNHNDVEGHRFRFGGRTNSAFSEKWIAHGYLAYGTLDREVKYNAQIERFLSRRSWTLLGIQHSTDVERLGATDEFYSKSTFTSFATSFGGTDKLNRVSIFRAWLETDLFRGFTQKVVLMNKTYNPASPDYKFAYFTDAARTDLASDLTLTELNLTSIYQPKGTFIVDKNERFPVSFYKAPTLSVGYSLGIDHMLGSDFSYHKASLGVDQRILLGSLGHIGYNLNLSKTFTPLPYPLLHIFHANESFFRTSNTFNLMKYGEFVADESLELFVALGQDGFILDKVPLIKKLQWRSVATASMALGRFNESRNGFYDPVQNPDGILARFMPDGSNSTSFKTLDGGEPYLEVSYGIENIFQLFRVEAIHRLTYLQPDANGQKPNRFAVKFSAVFRF